MKPILRTIYPSRKGTKDFLESKKPRHVGIVTDESFTDNGIYFINNEEVAQYQRHRIYSDEIPIASCAKIMTLRLRGRRQYEKNFPCHIDFMSKKLT